MGQQTSAREECAGSRRIHPQEISERLGSLMRAKFREEERRRLSCEFLFHKIQGLAGVPPALLLLRRFHSIIKPVFLFCGITLLVSSCSLRIKPALALQQNRLAGLFSSTANPPTHGAASRTKRFLPRTGKLQTARMTIGHRKKSFDPRAFFLSITLVCPA